MPHEKFHYKTLEQLRAACGALGVRLPLCPSMDILRQPLDLGGPVLPNRLAIQPMEGCDGMPGGSPSPLTLRRYDRFARSGAGLIWMEAVAILPEGRANPRQLYLNTDNLDAYRRLVDSIRETAQKETGVSPLLILQATHSGRYAKPEGAPAPLIAYNNPLFEGERPSPACRILSDSALDALPERYANTARLAAQAGFDGVDIKCCHRYLLSELLSAYTRPGRYGGPLENRARLLLDAVEAARAATPSSFLLTCRLNLYDGFPYPYGFGVKPEGGVRPEMGEAITLARWLGGRGIQLIDYTLGNPYVNPHVNRPYDAGGYVPDEHPLKGVARMMDCIRTVKQAVPALKVVGSGFSYLRQFSAQLAAGAVQDGVCDAAGFGRMAFAYPDFAKDILSGTGLDPSRCCLACGKCSELMRAGSMAGCVVRDREVYLPLYNRDVMRREVKA